MAEMILKYTVVSVISVISLAVAAVAGLLIFWIGDREEPAVVERVWLVPKDVKACDNIEAHVKRYKSRTSGVYVERYFKDSTGERAPLPTTNLEDNPGAYGDEGYYITFQVPCTLSPGWATYNVTTSYWRNPLQRYVWPIPGGRWAIPFCIIDDAQPSEQVCRKSPEHRGQFPAGSSARLP